MSSSPINLLGNSHLNKNDTQRPLGDYKTSESCFLKDSRLDTSDTYHHPISENTPFFMAKGLLKDKV
jgi:hypothetical protein